MNSETVSGDGEGEGYVELLAAARGGDAEALKRLIVSERDWLLGGCSHLLAKGAHVVGFPEDLAQETLTRALMSTATLRSQSRTQFRGWLFKIATFALCSSLRRSRSSDLAVEDFVPESDPPSTGGRIVANASRMARAREKLSYKEDASLMLRGYCGANFGVIAFVLNCKSTLEAADLHSRTMRKLRLAVADGRPE